MLNGKSVTVESPNTTRAVTPHGYWIVIAHVNVGPIDFSEKDKYCQLRTNDIDFHYFLQKEFHSDVCGSRAQLVERLITFAEQHGLEMYIAPCDQKEKI